MSFDNWSLAIGVAIGFSFLIGALLYKWTKEEVDKWHKYLPWLMISILTANYIYFAISLKWSYVFLFIAILTWILIFKKSKENTLIQPWLMGAAFAFALRLIIRDTAALVFLAYAVILGSYICRNSKDYFKKALKLSLNFLTAFLIVFVIPLPRIVDLHAFLVILALITPFLLLERKVFKVSV